MNYNKLAKKAQNLLRRNNNKFHQYFVIAQVEFDHYGEQFRDDQSFTYSEYTNSLVDDGCNRKLAEIIGMFHFVLDVFSEPDQTDFQLGNWIIPAYHLQHVKEFSHAMRFCYLTLVVSSEDSKPFEGPIGLTLIADTEKEIQLIKSDRGFFDTLSEFEETPQAVLCITSDERGAWKRYFGEEYARVSGRFLGNDQESEHISDCNPGRKPNFGKVLKWSKEVVASRTDLVKIVDYVNAETRKIVYRFSGLCGQASLDAQNELIWLIWRMFEDTALFDSDGSVCRKEDLLSYESYLENIKKGTHYSVLIKNSGSEFTLSSESAGLTAVFDRQSNPDIELNLQLAADNLSDLTRGRSLKIVLDLLSQHAPFAQEDQNIAFFDAYSLLTHLASCTPEEFNFEKASVIGKFLPEDATQESLINTIREMRNNHEELTDVTPEIHILNVQSDNGYSNAYLFLAEMWKLGINGKTDYQLAAGYYYLAAECHCLRAEEYLAFSMEEGNVCLAKDPAGSIRWCIRAADDGSASAQLKVGLAYEAGTIVKKDLNKAAEYLSKASDQGFSGASEVLKRVKKEMAAEKKTPSAAFSPFPIGKCGKVFLTRISRSGNLVGRLEDDGFYYGQVSIVNTNAIPKPETLIGTTISAKILQFVSDEFYRGIYKVNKSSLKS